MAEGAKDKPGVMVLHRKQDGSVTGQRMPDQHILSARFIERHLGGLVEVKVTIKTDDGDKTYNLTGFTRVTEGDKDSDFNFTSWELDAKKEAK